MSDHQSRVMQAFYEAGDTQRWHTLPHHGDASVARHSWGLAVFVMTFCPEPTMALIRAALLHDAHERWTGDCPSPARRAIPSLQAGEDEGQDRFWGWVGQPNPETVLTEEELLWLKLGDSVEAWLWTKQQWAMGNQHAAHPNYLLLSWFKDLIKNNPDVFKDPDGLIKAITSINLGNRLPEGIADLEKLYD